MEQDNHKEKNHDAYYYNQLGDDNKSEIAQIASELAELSNRLMDELSLYEDNESDKQVEKDLNTAILDFREAIKHANEILNEIYT